MASNKLTVSDLDFDSIKTNLKTFLQSQSEFQDYNFEGSGFSILLDLLAYNTHYLGFNANMLANEMYLDSADIRKNIVSLAKMLGYTPTSAKSPTVNLDILINNASGASLTMSKGTVFTSSISGNSYQFVTNEIYTLTPTDGVYKFQNIPVYEGTLNTFKYTVNTSDPDQRFIIPSVNADTTTLKVSVQNSSGDTATSTYNLATSITSLDLESKVYFLQEVEDGKFEIYFGDGVIGKSLSDGNIIIMEYVVTNKTEANGASNFTLSGAIETFSDVSITTDSAAQGGAEPQTKESIRYNAPLQYSAQDRAVTTSDYETKVLELYPNAQSVSAWGGENDETPVYGVVKIAIKAASGSTLTDATKESIVSKLRKYNVASVRPIIVDPETTSIILTSNIKYDQKATTKNTNTLKSEITTAISNYNTNTLQQFDGVFRHSKITGLIDNVDNSILSNVTSLMVRKTFTPTINSSTKYDIYFRNGIFNPHSGHKSVAGGVITTSGFKVPNDEKIYFLDDDGIGNIRRYYFSGSVRTYANTTQGTVDYATGQITINSLNISSIENIRGASSNDIEITIEPASYDIVPVRDQIIEIDTANSKITVESDTFVGGSSTAGVGYTTTSNY
tara:strand:- start:843 stop:2696 length:1854 start_codon:yes stop_codon:yes gene_type:complete